MCGVDKPVADFARCSTSRDGLYSRCRQCSNAASRAYGQANADKIAERRRQYDALHGDEQRTRRRAWYAEHRDRALESAARYRIMHREQLRERDRARRAADPELYRHRNAVYREKNRDTIATRRAAYYWANRDAALRNNAEYRAANSEAIRTARDRWFSRHPEYKARYYESNRDRWLTYSRRSREAARRADPIRYSLDGRMSRALRKSLGAAKAGRSAFAILGYSREDLVAHLEALFLPGMSWDNMGEWHIDHVVPKSWFSYDSSDHPAFKACWALENLQPLWGRDNASKGGRWAG